MTEKTTYLYLKKHNQTGLMYFGKTHSIETIQKIKEARSKQKPRIGYSWSAEQRAKFRFTILERNSTRV